MRELGLTVRAHALLLAATMLTMVSVVLAQWYTGHMGNGQALGIGGLALAPLWLLLLRRRLLLACVGYWLLAVPLLFVFCAREGGLLQLLVWTGAVSVTFAEALGLAMRGMLSGNSGETGRSGPPQDQPTNNDSAPDEAAPEEGD